MPRKGKPTGKPTGAPKKELDWALVDHLLEACNSGPTIAHKLGIGPTTLYERTMKEKGVTFSEYSQLKRKHGDDNIKTAQYNKAVSGDNTMLVWLGKNRIGQRETQEPVQLPPREEILKLEDENIKLREKIRHLENVSQP